MSYTNDPAYSNTDRVRLLIGDVDTDDEGLTDEVYSYVLAKHSGEEESTPQSEAAAAIECLKYLVAKYANYVTEKTGNHFSKESEKYEQYRELLVLFTQDPRTALTRVGTPYAGGISVSEFERNKADPDNRTVEYSVPAPTSCCSPETFRCS